MTRNRLMSLARWATWRFALMLLLIRPLAVAAGLAEQLISRDAQTQLDALKAIGGLDAAARAALVPALAKALRDPDPIIRCHAGEALGAIGAVALPALSEALKSQDSHVRYCASVGLTRLGPPALPVLTEALTGDNKEVRCLAASGLAQMQPRPSGAVPALLQALQHADADTRLCTAEALSGMDNLPPEIVPQLVAALRDPNPLVGSWALLALGHTGPTAAATVVPILSQALSSSDWRARRGAIRALGTLGAAAKDAIPALIHLLHAGDERERSVIVTALGDIGALTPEVVPALVEMLGSNDSNVKWYAAGALEKLGPAATEAAPALLHSCSDPDEHLRMQASSALEKIGAAAIPALVEALGDPDIDVRRVAAWHLGQLRAAAQSAVPALMAALEDVDTSMRASAAAALQQIATPAAQQALQRYREQPSRHPLDPTRCGQETQPPCSKAEVLAAIPPDAEHPYPMELEYLVPIEDTTLLVTLHRGQQRDDRLVIWANEAKQYKAVQVMDANDWSTCYFGQVTAFRYRREHFLHVPTFYYGTGHGRDDAFFWINFGKAVQRIPFERSAQFYRPHLKPGEAVWKGEELVVHDDDLRFEFYIWNERTDSNCCPSAGRVTGTYKIDGHQWYDFQQRKQLADFKVVVDTFERKPVAEAESDPN